MPPKTPNTDTNTNLGNGATPVPPQGSTDSVSGSPPNEPRGGDGRQSPTTADNVSERRAGKSGGPTLEEFTAAGYDAAAYPPKGYAEVPSDGLTKYRLTGVATRDGGRVSLDDGSTHLLVRSRNERFRRAGLAFTRDWQSLAVADLTDSQITSIENDGMLDTKRVSKSEADEYVRAGVMDDTASPAELKQALRTERERADAAEKALADYKASKVGDLPPAKGRMPDGTPIGH